MTKSIRSILTLAASVLLLGTLAMATGSAKKPEKAKDKEHHSKLGKVAFWRHGSHADKKAKPAGPKQASSKAPAAKPAKSAQAKPASVKQASAKKGQNQAQPLKKNVKPEHAKASKPAVNNAPAVKKTKSESKPEEPKTAALEQ